MQFEGILHSTTSFLSCFDDNVKFQPLYYSSNTFFLSFQLNGDEKCRFPVRCDISIHCPAFSIITSSLWVFGRTDIRFSYS